MQVLFGTQDGPSFSEFWLLPYERGRNDGGPMVGLRCRIHSTVGSLYVYVCYLKFIRRNHLTGLPEQSHDCGEITR